MLDERNAFGGYLEYTLERGAPPFLDRLWAVTRLDEERSGVGHWRLPDPRPNLVVRRLFAADGRLDRVITYLGGPKTAPIQVSFEPHTDSFGIRLHPEWLPSLFGISAAEVRDGWVHISEIAKPFARILGGVAETCLDPSDGTVLLLRETIRRFRSRSRGTDPAPGGVARKRATASLRR